MYCTAIARRSGGLRGFSGARDVPARSGPEFRRRHRGVPHPSPHRSCCGRGPSALRFSCGCAALRSTSITAESAPIAQLRSRLGLAVSVQLENWTALTLPQGVSVFRRDFVRSPGRGNSLRPRWDESLGGEVIRIARELLPLPGGEGRGEGERLIRLNSYGLGCPQLCPETAMTEAVLAAKKAENATWAAIAEAAPKRGSGQSHPERKIPTLQTLVNRHPFG